MEKKFALLIDAENTSVKYLDHIFKELQEYGIVTYKRMYGDFTSETLKEWNEKALEYAIVPIQQPRYSKTNKDKNASDIMLVIDAMDILYQGNVDGFCIVSSDSDFTRLVNRLCDDGMTIIGMGKSDASKSLKAACSEYKNLEKIFGDSNGAIDSQEDEKVDEDDITNEAIIKKNIMEIVQLKENRGEKTGLGGLKSQLQRTYSDFDERNYGYNSMTRFIKDMKEFDLIQEGSSVYVVKKDPKGKKEEVVSYILDLIKKSPIDLGRLGQNIHERYPDFNYKDYGYSQLGRFVSSIQGVVIEDKSATQKTVKSIL